MASSHLEGLTQLWTADHSDSFVSRGAERANLSSSAAQQMPYAPEATAVLPHMQSHRATR